MSQFTSKQTSDYLVEPALVGAGLAAGSMYWWGAAETFIVGDSKYTLWPLMAGLGFAATAAMNYVTNTVNDHLPDQVSVLTHPVEEGLAVAGTAGLMLTAEQLVSPGLAGETMYPLIGMAAAAKLGGRYVAHEYIMPWLDSFKA